MADHGLQEEDKSVEPLAEQSTQVEALTSWIKTEACREKIKVR